MKLIDDDFKILGFYNSVMIDFLLVIPESEFLVVKLLELI